MIRKKIYLHANERCTLCLADDELLSLRRERFRRVLSRLLPNRRRNRRVA
ncbi:MAG: hypothetical protein SX243_22030 [Acidobacteriota bacterium]|nr:hypothetical protein [Acidobacteriota bacterium]